MGGVRRRETLLGAQLRAPTRAAEALFGRGRWQAHCARLIRADDRGHRQRLPIRSLRAAQPKPLWRSRPECDDRTVGHDLLERQRELRTLTSLVERAVSGHGSTALVLGDAGIGKTSLVRELLATLPRDVRVLAAACEDLLTPRTLGPLRDAVRGRDGPLADALTSGADQDAVFAAVLAELGSGTPDAPGGR